MRPMLVAKIVSDPTCFLEQTVVVAEVLYSSRVWQQMEYNCSAGEVATMLTLS